MLVAGFLAQAQLTNAQGLVAGLRVPAAMKKSSRQSAEAYATPAAYPQKRTPTAKLKGAGSE